MLGLGGEKLPSLAGPNFLKITGFAVEPTIPCDEPVCIAGFSCLVKRLEVMRGIEWAEVEPVAGDLCSVALTDFAEDGAKIFVVQLPVIGPARDLAPGDFGVVVVAAATSVVED